MSPVEAACAALEPLSGRERGFVLGGLIAADPAVVADSLTRLEGGWQTRCADALAALNSTDRQVRLEVTRRLTQQVAAPLPEGIEGVHPSWIAALLSVLPEPAAAAVVQALPPAVQQRLPSHRVPTHVPSHLGQRLASDVLGALQPMAPSAATADPEGRDLLSLPDVALLPMLERAGCLTLAALAQRAGAAHQRQLEKTLDAAHARMLRHACTMPLSVQREHLSSFAQAWQRAARATVDDNAGGHEPPVSSEQRSVAALLNLGITAAARALPRSVALTLAQRLPRHHGLGLHQATSFGPDPQLLGLLRAARDGAPEVAR